MGTRYLFKVQARNAFGYSADSATVSILQAEKPLKPDAPTTLEISDQAVIIDWNAPSDQGSPITAYIIYIRHADEVTYSTELTACDGSESNIVSGTSCSIPISTLQADPFNLPWGSSIYAKVEAINDYGTSDTSVHGNGALILTKPDTPIDFQDNTLYTTAT